MAELSVKLVTPERELVRAKMDSVTAPSVLGEVGILPDHLPLLASLQPGPVALSRAGRTDYYAVSGGFLEVHDNIVTILADSAEAASELDKRRARHGMDDAKAKLAKLDYLDPEYAEQQARLRRAEVRLHVAELGEKGA